MFSFLRLKTFNNTPRKLILIGQMQVRPEHAHLPANSIYSRQHQSRM